MVRLYYKIDRTEGKNLVSYVLEDGTHVATFNRGHLDGTRAWETFVDAWMDAGGEIKSWLFSAIAGRTKI
jgi:hypothetical protein